MIITCEKCTTRFELADEKIPDGGVKVRCSKCSHVFRAERRSKTLSMFRDQVVGSASLPVAPAPKNKPIATPQAAVAPPLGADHSLEDMPAPPDHKPHTSIPYAAAPGPDAPAPARFDPLSGALPPSPPPMPEVKDPFGGDPFGGGAQTDFSAGLFPEDPFSNPVFGNESVAPPADPFAMPAQAAKMAEPAPPESQSARPTAAVQKPNLMDVALSASTPDLLSQGADPFGAAAMDPFGAAAADPFGASTDPFSGSTDPFKANADEVPIAQEVPSFDLAAPGFEEPSLEVDIDVSSDLVTEVPPPDSIPGFDAGMSASLDNLGTMNSLEGGAVIDPDEARLIEIAEQQEMAAKAKAEQASAPPVDAADFTDPFADLPGFENPAKASDPFGQRGDDDYQENATMIREIPAHIRAMATVREKEPEPTKKRQAAFDTLVLAAQAFLLLVFLALAVVWGRGVTFDDIREGRALSVILGNQASIANEKGFSAHDVVVTRYPREGVDEDLVIISGIVKNATAKDAKAVEVRVQFSEEGKPFTAWANNSVSSLELDKARSRFDLNRIGSGDPAGASIKAGKEAPFFVLARGVPDGKRARVEAVAKERRAPQDG